ncbi:GON domain-containing protein [Candidatus Leptofilum sp.]|uniref:GON domain-containing protein n=1 Tax=Candidatus Leptofilum sp. TaxID=3241576 RepID=UPI003B5BD543
MIDERSPSQPLLNWLLLIGGGLVVLAFYLGYVLLNQNTVTPDKAEATTVALIATQIATLQPTSLPPTRFATVTPSPVPLPNSCAMLKQQQPTAEDGEYTLYLRGKTAVPLYCYNMATKPQEYLTLPATTTGGNFSLISYPEGAIVTLYEKVRLNPSSLIVDPTDMTFATLADSFSGYNALIGEQLANYPVASSDFAQATSCNRNQPDAPLGRANVDLTGTPFVLNPAIRFSSFGGEVNETINEISADGKVMTLAVNGRCGIIQPSNPIQLVYQQP